MRRRGGEDESEARSRLAGGSEVAFDEATSSREKPQSLSRSGGELAWSKIFAVIIGGCCVGMCVAVVVFMFFLAEAGPHDSRAGSIRSEAGGYPGIFERTGFANGTLRGHLHDYLNIESIKGRVTRYGEQTKLALEKIHHVLHANMVKPVASADPRALPPQTHALIYSTSRIPTTSTVQFTRQVICQARMTST